MLAVVLGLGMTLLPRYHNQQCTVNNSHMFAEYTIRHI